MKQEKAGQNMKTLIGRLLLLAGIFESALSEVIEVCISEDLHIGCRGEEVILVERAEFGRMEVGRCITEEDQFLGCTNDVLPLLDRWCSGRKECSFMVTNDDLEAANKNCLKILMKYLKVEYTCLEVDTVCHSRMLNVISKQSGYISSLVSEKIGCGSTKSLWSISSNAGQTVQLELIDFGVRFQSVAMTSCRSVYGFVLEKALGINQTICGGTNRRRVIYMSKTNSMQIQLLAKQSRSAVNFLVKYSITGCPEVIPPAHAWYKREGDEALIGCDNSDKEWHLRCVDNKWSGDVGNCSEIVILVKQETAPPSAIQISSIVVISGVAGAAVVLSVIAVVSGIIYINKYRMKQEIKRANLYKTYSTIGANVQTYYCPISGNQPENSGAPWDTPTAVNQMAPFSERCTCPTLQMRNQGNVDKTEGERSMERQSLYSSIRST